MLKLLHYESFGWDALFTVPQFEFFFKVAIPKKQKAREIIERDYLGRIVKAKASDKRCFII